MTGKVFFGAGHWRIALALVGTVGLAACDENGEFALPGGDSAAAASEPVPANAPNQTIQSERDIERPDIFEVTDRGLWDGRPSLGGVWVAHPDAQDPERVVIRNDANGQSIIGALFRRERENPGPLLQVSSDAADALGVLAGAPTELTVIALRRAEVEVEATPDANPVVASLEAPVSIAAAPLDPVDADAAGEAAPESDDSAPIAVVLPPAVEAAASAVEVSTEAAAATVAAATEVTTEAVEETIDVSAVIAAPPQPLPDGTIAQVGVYSVEANAGAAARRIIDAGLPANVFAEEIGGRTVWRVIAGPLADDGAIPQLKELGFVDAFIIEDDEDAEE